ncbi:hypothetical protein BDN67DRAFT_917729, partial [Paxillus ammoniavirescens]
HHPRRDCECQNCEHDRKKGCGNLHHCATTARTILSRLAPKFNTYTRAPKDNLTLTHHRKEKNSRVIVNKGDEIVFDPSLTARSSLAECFRVFVDPRKTATELALCPKIPRQYHNNAPIPMQEAYTDGSCVNNRKQNAASGSGIYFGENHPLNTSIRIPGEAQSNQTAEIAAILVVIQRAVGNQCSLHMYLYTTAPYWPPTRSQALAHSLVLAPSISLVPYPCQ